MTQVVRTATAPAPVTLADLERIRDLFLSNPPPPKEVRLHPSDVEYLRARYGTYQVVADALAMIRLVEDEGAPLLPRATVARDIFSR